MLDPEEGFQFVEALIDLFKIRVVLLPIQRIIMLRAFLNRTSEEKKKAAI